MSSTVELRVAGVLPVVSGFELTEGFVSGPLNGQQGWEGVGEVFGSVQGEGRLRLPAAPETGWAAIHFVPDSQGTVVFAGAFVRPYAALTPDDGVVAEFAGARVAFVRSNAFGEGEFMVFADGVGDGEAAKWRRIDQPASVALELDGRASYLGELSIRYDLGSDRWDLHIDGMIVAADLKAPRIDAIDRWRLRFATQGAGEIELDDVYLDRENRSFTDLDRDGMDDDWERYYGLDPSRNDRAEDADADGVSNVLEFVLWTDPNLADTDGDGLGDGLEHRLGLDPNAFTYPTDDDEDGRSQIEELQAGTDPNDFFDGRTPALVIVSEPGDPDGRLVVKVTTPDGEPWPHAPVRFAASGGEASFATNPDSTITHREIEVRSDASGLVTIFVRPGIVGEANP